ncbi:MAG: YaaA family protein [Arcobacteraceae bacterium]|nr:YaaA family protein [Arcobacteraceae bacterium]
MKILLAPAETKNEGGTRNPFCKENFKFQELFPFQEHILKLYEKHIQALNLEELSQWFGLKNLKEVEKYQHSLYTQPTMKAIQRYNGVAFDALEYASLPKQTQKYIDDNVILFSNLFGVLNASDLIPNYKYKQGAKLPEVVVEKYYNENTSSFLDEHLGEEILDLRAGFYEKFYQPKHAKVLTFKFIKEGKVISHWAKHYRGKLLRQIALHNIQNFSEFMSVEFDELKLLEIQEKKNVKLLILDIV